MTKPTPVLRVLHLVSSLDARYGGPAVFVPQLARELARRRCEVAVLAASHFPDETLLIDDSEGFLKAIYPVPLPAFNKFYYSPRLRDAALRWVTPDTIVHVHGLWLYPAYLGLLLHSRFGCPLVVRPHGGLHPVGFAWTPWKKWKKVFAQHAFAHRLLRSANVIHATSSQEALAVRSKLKSPTPIVVLPNGVVLPTEPSSPRRKAERRVTRLGFISRIHPSKGLHILLDALALIDHELKWELLIVGPTESDPYFSNVRRQAKRTGVWRRVRTIGAVPHDEIPSILSQLDYFVLPTVFESYGIAIAEALAAGVPVITTTSTPWHEIAESGAGWLVPPNQRDDLKDALVAALTLPESARQAKAALSQEVAQSQSIERCAANIVELYRGIQSRQQGDTRD